MHEIGLMSSLLSAAALAANGDLICTLRVQVGLLSGVVPEALQFAFKTLAPNTPARDAKLDLTIVPPTFRCRECNQNFATPAGDGACPNCGATTIEMCSGNELELTSIEVPDQPNRSG